MDPNININNHYRDFYTDNFNNINTEDFTINNNQSPIKMYQNFETKKLNRNLSNYSDIPKNNIKQKNFTTRINSSKSLISNLTPNHSFKKKFTKPVNNSRITSNNSRSKTNLKNNTSNFQGILINKDPNKTLNIINKLTEEVEHVKKYCIDLQRQFDNHCLIRNEKKEFENIKKENIKLTAEVSILKDDISELMKKFNLINNKIDSMQQENSNLKMQNKNLMNFLSSMNENGISKLKSFNVNNLTNNNIQYSINKSNNNINPNYTNSNNESMNIINLINKKNSSTNLNSEQLLDTSIFNISKSINKNIDNKVINNNNFSKTLNPIEYKVTGYNSSISNEINRGGENNDVAINISKDMKVREDKGINNNATDLLSLIQSNFNLTNNLNKFSNTNHNFNQNRYLIPKNEN